MAALETYMMLVKQLTEAYKLNFYMEHKFIHEFFEEKIPLFKLIYAVDPKTKDNRVLVSFHLDMDAVDAIQWFDKICTSYPNARLAECYYKDDMDETYLGQDAEVIKMYKLEQEIVTKWLEQGEEKAKKFAESQIAGRERPKGKSFTDRDEAFAEFHKMQKGEEDEYN